LPRAGDVISRFERWVIECYGEWVLKNPFPRHSQKPLLANKWSIVTIAQFPLGASSL
jgi:hypothetical protein